jgi:hypothetical protein
LSAQQEISEVAFRFPLKTLSAALLFTIAGSFSAYADDPTPAALESARTIIAAWGMTRSFDVVVPQMMELLERNVGATRPELKVSLHATLAALTPEFAKTEVDFINSAAQVLTRRMSEQELKDTAAFFQTPSGKKYIESEPAAISEIVGLVQAWREKLSNDILARAHEEMKKKGADF